MWRAFAARTRPLPTGVWISRSKKVVTGSGKPSSPNGAAGCLDESSRLAALRSTHTEGSACGADYHRLVARGLKQGSALMAVMRKMLAVTASLERGRKVIRGLSHCFH